MAQISSKEQKGAIVANPHQGLDNVMNNTIKVARLKLLFIAAKLVFHSNQEKVKYSIRKSSLFVAPLE